MNKIGLHIGYWWGTGVEDDIFKMLDLTHKAQIDIIEINPAWLLRLSNKQCREFLKCLKDYNMSATLNGGLDSTNDISADSEEVRRLGIKYCTEVLKRMSALQLREWSGINYSAWLRTPLPDSNLQEEKKRAKELAIKSLKEIIKVAEDLDINYCLEVVNRYEQFLFNTVKEAIDFTDQIESPNTKLLLDTYHMNIEEDNISEAIEYAAKYENFGYLHVGESNRRVPGIGKSNLNWNQIANSLNLIDYKGPIVMEPFILTTAHNAKRTRVWRDLSNGSGLKEMVEMAHIGGDFLRNTLKNN